MGLVVVTRGAKRVATGSDLARSHRVARRRKGRRGAARATPVTQVSERMSGDSEGKATMTFHEIINLHPHPSDVDRNLLLRCIEECLDCAASCTACADACLGESELAELRGSVRLNLDCADACEATGRIVTRQTSPDLRLIKATVEACAVACLACAEECDRHAAHHEHCRVCATVCRRCKQACDELALAIG